MALRITSTSPSGLGHLVAGLDLSRPLADRDIDAIRAAYRESPVLCLRGGVLDPAAFCAVARYFGEPKIQVLRGFRHSEFAEISFISSDQRDTLGDGKRIAFGSHWHTDDSYLSEPCASTMLHANVVPAEGGDTLFANMYAAYDALPEALRDRIAGLKAVHKYQSRRNVSPVPRRSAEEAAETPDVVHPLVCTHPETGRKTLYLNPNRIDHLVGLDLAEGDRLLDELIAHATRPAFVYRHRWQAGDLVLWDNRCTMHKASADYGDQTREMMRILLVGTRPE